MKRILLHGGDIGKGNLILVNKKYPIVCDPVQQQLQMCHPEYPDIRLEQHAARMLRQLLVHLDCFSQIVPVSGYRSQIEQQQIYRDTLRQHGKEYTRKFVAVPGCSEHQSGLAVDLAKNQEEIDFICPLFPRTGIFQEFRELASRYGFVERYPAGKEETTDIGAEPWHFRFVGYPHARILEQLHLTLEEYMVYLQDFLQHNPFRWEANGQVFQVFFVPVRAGTSSEILVPDSCHAHISGNNVSGFIVTLWEEFV